MDIERNTPKEPENHADCLHRPTGVPELILSKLGEKNMPATELSKLTGFSHSTIYRVIKRGQRASRDLLLCIAFALRMNDAETAQLLHCGGRAVLSLRRERDMAIRHGMANGLSLEEMNTFLEKCGMPPLSPLKKTSGGERWTGDLKASEEITEQEGGIT